MRAFSNCVQLVQVLSHGFALWPNAADRHVLQLAPADLHTVRALD